MILSFSCKARSRSRIMFASSKFFVFISRSSFSRLSMASCAEVAFSCTCLNFCRRSRCSCLSWEYSLASASYFVRQVLTCSASKLARLSIFKCMAYLAVLGSDHPWKRFVGQRYCSADRVRFLTISLAADVSLMWIVA